MKTNAVQKSLKSLRENGWSCHIVEKFIPARGDMKFPRRVDAFNFGDILAMRPRVYGEACPKCKGEGIEHSFRGDIVCDRCYGVGKIEIADKAIALVQCCPGASHAAHKEKILAIPEFKIWKDSGGRVFLQSWALKGARGQRKRWTLREEVL